jgi:hypothetical protein
MGGWAHWGGMLNFTPNRGEVEHLGRIDAPGCCKDDWTMFDDAGKRDASIVSQEAGLLLAGLSRTGCQPWFKLTASATDGVAARRTSLNN